MSHLALRLQLTASSCPAAIANGKCSLYVYEVCVIEYLDAYMDMAKVCKTKRGVFIKNVGLIHDPLFLVHKEKGSEVIVVTNVPTTREIKVTEFIPRPESKLVKAIGRLRSRISSAIKGARNSIASRIAAD